MGSSRVWTRRSSTWVTLGLLVAMVAGTWWLLARGTRGAEVANILALPVSLLGLVVAAYGITQRSPATDHAVLLLAARELAGAVARHEAAVQQRLLSDTGDTRPANVGYAQLDAALVRWRTDGGEESGSLNTVADFYQRLDRGRLIVLGKAGAGKTVLALRGLLDLIRALPEEDPKPGVRLNVPVRLSLPDWTVDPAEPAAPAQQAVLAEPAVLAQRLDAWIAAHLVTVYGVRPAVAHALVTRGWVVPILDGLDEVDPDDQPPVRAQAVVQALNHPSGTGPRPFLLTCREHRYAALGEMIQDATAVRVQPLSVEQVAQWLTYRFPDHTKPPGIEHRWLKVLRQLDIDRTGPLATCLTSPLRLYLTVTAYRDPATDPEELLAIPADELDEHLFSRLIPAVVKAHGTYEPDNVTRWLGTLAEHLNRDSRSKTDLNVFALWRTAEHYGPVPLLTSSLYSILVTAGLVSGWALAISTDPHRFLVPTLSSGLLLGALLVLPTVTSLVNTMRPPRDPDLVAGVWEVRRLSLGRLGRIGSSKRRAIVARVGFVITFSTVPPAIDQPSRIVRQVGGFDLTFGLVGALTVATGVLLTTGVPQNAAYAMVTLFTIALGFRTATFWPRYLVSTSVLARARKLPFRPARFLDWAYDAGLLRLSGITVQFRHTELQHWLTMKQP